MPDFFQTLQNGTANLWLFIPTAILLGGLHGLEPGHSKTMMAAFIIAIRGTMSQAVLLGISAAISHSLIIAVLAMSALYLGSQWNAENIEPYLQLGSAIGILGLALWMFLRARRELHEAHHHHHHHNGAADVYQDAHELEHAEDIRRRFAERSATTPQIVFFGLSGGLIPCPAAFSVLLVCLQLKRVALGYVLVASFSIGLALTMVTAGALAAWSVQHAQRKFRGFENAMRHAPYISCAVLAILSAYMGWHGWLGIRGL